MKKEEKKIEAILYYIGDKRMMSLISPVKLKNWYNNMSEVDKEYFKRQSIEDKIQKIVDVAGESISGPVTWLVFDETNHPDQASRKSAVNEFGKINLILGEEVIKYGG